METKSAILELRIPLELDPQGITEVMEVVADEIEAQGFLVDRQFPPVPVPPSPDIPALFNATDDEFVVLRGAVVDGAEQALESDPRVVKIWSDPPIFPLHGGGPPCDPYDCDRSASGAKGDLNDVARYLGVERIWKTGRRGQGITIGICDTGVRRNVVPNVVGGWSPPNTASWGDPQSYPHGTMCAVDALGMCPNASILDIGIMRSPQSISPLLSNAILAYNWVIDKYRRDGTPQILSNSWGIYSGSSSSDYAYIPSHPFTRKVVEVIRTGILVCFAAGNCGEVCPLAACGSDTGPGKSIWGANGHPDVITAGAANINEEWIGYSSQGPSSLGANKPDVCAPSHFRGYFLNDTGTSAACAVLAGVLGLLRNAKPSLRQAEAKRILEMTARPICGAGWNPQGGHGMIQAKAALDAL